MRLRRCQASLASVIHAARLPHASRRGPLRSELGAGHPCSRFASSACPAGERAAAGAGLSGAEHGSSQAPARPGRPDEPDAEQRDQETDIPPEVAELFDILREEALRRLDEFGPIHLFSLCWAYSTARLLDPELRQRVAAAALQLGEARDRSPRPGGERAGDAGAAPAGREGGGPEEEGREPVASATEGQEGREQPAPLAEGRHWLAFYKPPFWQVNVDSKEAARAAAVPFEEEDDGDADDDAGPEEQRRRPRMHAWVRQHYAPRHAICTDAAEAFGLLHRLDAQTSGLLLCAKTYAGAYWLRLQWCSYLVDKEYVCLVHGWVDRGVREVHKRIRVEKKKAPNSRRTISTHCTVGANGKPSYTEVCTLAHLARPAADAGAAADEPYSLVVLKLHTGRTHQIRVHMTSIGHPLVCDIKYGEDRFAADRAWCPRNFLHTYHLGFNDVPEGPEPADAGEAGGRPVKLNCPLPGDLQSALALLRPVDDVSARYRDEWLSREGGRLRSFEEYAADFSA